MQLTDYQKLWEPCTSCGATATVLNMWGTKYAGIWECLNDECGASDVCRHLDYRVDRAADDFGEYELYTCNSCECDVPLEEARV